MENKKTIGVLTSGGDAPGMNAAVRAVVRAGLKRGMNVVGIKRGYNGLINGDIIDMKRSDVSDVIQRGGTILYTARCLEFKEQAGVLQAAETCKEQHIDGIVVIGGDGSFRGASDLSKAGVPCIGLPGTIDNDIVCTDYTIGYDTAMNTAMEMVDKLRDTSQSHDRCSVIEVMGRNAGYIALNTGIAVGATFILVPEVDVEISEMVEAIKKAHEQGKEHFLIVVAEGVAEKIGGCDNLAKQIEAETSIETRATILGHVQRGGSPTVRDRVAASRLGYRAVELLDLGIGNRVVGFDKDQVVDYDITEGLKMTKKFPLDLYQVSNNLVY